MRTAVFLSGQPRNVERAYPYIYEHLLEPNNPDVFIHCWFDPEIDTGQAYINAGGHVASHPIPIGIDRIIKRLYTPKLSTFEKQIQFDEKNYNERRYPAIRPFFSISQRYSILQSTMLKTQWEYEQGFTYDVVVRLRFDYALYDTIYLDRYDVRFLNLPNRCPHPNAVDDTFAFSSSRNMNIYADLYNHLDEYYNKDGIVFCDEHLLNHHLLKNKLEIRKYNIRYDLLRD